MRRPFALAVYPLLALGLCLVGCPADDDKHALLPTDDATITEQDAGISSDDTGPVEDSGVPDVSAPDVADAEPTPDQGAEDVPPAPDTADCGGCDDQNACTVDHCKDGECVYEPSHSPECAPSVHFTYPPRGGIFGYSESVLVEGEAKSPSGSDSKLLVNGDETATDPNGLFSTGVVGPQHGINTLSAEVTDASGQGRAVQSFLMGEGFYNTTSGNPKDALVNNGLVTFLGADLWDDDDLDDVDDVATVAHLVLQSLDVAALLPQPLTPAGEEPGIGWCEWTIFITEVTYDVYNVDVAPKAGGALLSGSLSNLVIGFDAKAPDFGCPDAIGTATAAVVTLGAFVTISLGDDFKPKVGVADGDVDVVIGPLTFDITGGFASGLEWLLNWFNSSVSGWIETAVEGALVSKVSPLVAELINGVSVFAQAFEIPPLMDLTAPVTATIGVVPSHIQLSQDGAVIGVAASLTAVAGPDDLDATGSLARNGCFGGEESPLQVPTNAHIAIAIHDDLLNQGLFAAWWSGLLHVKVDPSVLETLKVELPVDDLSAEVELLLPPILTSCTPNGTTQLQLGDLKVSASFNLNGAPASLTAFASGAFEVDLDAAPAEGATVELTFGVSSVVNLEFEILETTGAIEGAKDVTQLLLSNIVEDVVVNSLSAGVFQSFPVPTFDISTIIPGIPEATTLTFVPHELVRQGGYIVLNGTVVE